MLIRPESPFSSLSVGWARRTGQYQEMWEATGVHTVEIPGSIRVQAGVARRGAAILPGPPALACSHLHFPLPKPRSTLFLLLWLTPTRTGTFPL